MNLLAIDRSTEIQSAALAQDGVVHSRVFAGENARSADWPIKIREFLAEHGLAFGQIDRIVVGTGPGSFAGIRAAIAFMQGIAIGTNVTAGTPADGTPSHTVELFGMPSSLALAGDAGKTAVIGDARREKLWVVLYDGVKTVADFKLMGKEELSAYVPDGFSVVTPDGARIGDLLAGVFGLQFRGNVTPLARRLAEIACAHPECTVPEPLPVYLAPAVRT